MASNMNEKNELNNCRSRKKHNIQSSNTYPVHPILVGKLLQRDRLPTGPGGAHGLVDLLLVPLPDLGLNLGNPLLVGADAGAERGQQDSDSEPDEVEDVEDHRDGNDEDHEDPESESIL